MRRWRYIFLLAVSATAWSAGPLAGQEAASGEDYGWSVGGGFGASVLLGEGDSGQSGLFDVGLGVDANASWARGWAGRLGLRGSLGLMKLGADADAENLLFHALFGPLVAVELGPVAPWAHPVAGVVGTRWDRGPGPDPDAPDLSRTGTSATWGLGLAGGLAIRLTGGGTPVALQLGGRIVEVGELTFARASLVGPDAFGHDSSVLTLRAGLSVGLGR